MAPCTSFDHASHRSKANHIHQTRSRPGILVLINDSDWELEGEDKYELTDNDNVLFVSTLHGG